MQGAREVEEIPSMESPMDYLPKARPSFADVQYFPQQSTLRDLTGLISADSGNAVKHDDSHLNGSVERPYMDIGSGKTYNQGDDYETKFVQPPPWEIRQEFDYETDWEKIQTS